LSLSHPATGGVKVDAQYSDAYHGVSHPWG
jgi:hypothetical protein